MSDTPPPNPKGTLQEIFQQASLPIPSYQTSPSPPFISSVTLYFDHEKVRRETYNSSESISKKSAEADAALQALTRSVNVQQIKADPDMALRSPLREEVMGRSSPASPVTPVPVQSRSYKPGSADDHKHTSVDVSDETDQPYRRKPFECKTPKPDGHLLWRIMWVSAQLKKSLEPRALFFIAEWARKYVQELKEYQQAESAAIDKEWNCFNRSSAPSTASPDSFDVSLYHSRCDQATRLVEEETALCEYVIACREEFQRDLQLLVDTLHQPMNTSAPTTPRENKASFSETMDVLEGGLQMLGQCDSRQVASEADLKGIEVEAMALFVAPHSRLPPIEELRSLASECKECVDAKQKALVALHKSLDMQELEAISASMKAGLLTRELLRTRIEGLLTEQPMLAAELLEVISVAEKPAKYSALSPASPSQYQYQPQS